MGPTFSSVAPLVTLLSALYFQQVSPVLKKVTSDSYVRKKKKKKSFLIILTRCQDTGFSSSWENEIRHSGYRFIFWINSWGRLYAILVQEATFSTAIR